MAHEDGTGREEEKSQKSRQVVRVAQSSGLALLVTRRSEVGETAANL